MRHSVSNSTVRLNNLEGSLQFRNLAKCAIFNLWKGGNDYGLQIQVREGNANGDGVYLTLLRAGVRLEWVQSGQSTVIWENH